MDFYALFLVLLVFAVSDWLIKKSKGKLSSVFLVLFLFLILFLAKVFPANIIKRSGLTQVGTIATGFLIFHMGTMMKWNDIKQEWRTVVVSCLSILVTVICILLVITPLYGKYTAFTSVPSVMGAVVTQNIINQAALKAGMTRLAALAVLVFAVHKLVGIPLASYFGRKEALKWLDQFRKSSGSVFAGKETPDTNATTVEHAESFYEKHHLDQFYSIYTCLAVTGFFVWISNLLGNVTHLNYTIWVLIFGIIVHQFKLVPDNILDRAKSTGFLNMAIFAALIPALANIKLSNIISLGIQAVVIIAVMVAGQIIFFYLLPVWKIMGSRNMGFGVALCQMLGYPSTYLVSNEIATYVGTTEEERGYILKQILPRYLIAGFVSVTILSVFVAGIMASLL